MKTTGVRDMNVNVRHAYDNYTIVLPIRETVYQGCDRPIDVNYQDIFWASLDLDVAKQYGRVVHRYVTTKPYKLIDINNNQFKIEYMIK